MKDIFLFYEFQVLMKEINLSFWDTFYYPYILYLIFSQEQSKAGRICWLYHQQPRLQRCATGQGCTGEAKVSIKQIYRCIVCINVAASDHLYCRHHLQNDGIIDLKTTTSENFNFEGRVEKVDRVNRDNLRLSGERALKTTHHDFKVHINNSDIIDRYNR